MLQLQRRARTKSDGAFVFDSVRAGTYTIEARRSGYKTSSSDITVSVSGAVIEIRLERAATFLPSVVTKADRGGLSGTIGDTAYHALAGVHVAVLGGSASTNTDSTGNFFMPVTAGHYLVALTRSGFARQLMSVTIPVGGGRQIAAWMVPQSGGANPYESALLSDIPVRMIRSRPIWDKYYTREDMEQQGFTDLRQIGSRSSMRLMNPDCPVIVNGDPQRIVPLWSLTVPELEFVEVYTDPTKSPTGGPAGGSRANLAAKKKQMSTAPKSPCGVALVAWLRN